MKTANNISHISVIARKRYAEELFDPTRVAALIEARAAEGYRELKIIQTYPFDLMTLPAARKLEDWLDANNYRYAWHPTPPLVDPLSPFSNDDYPELVISW